MVFNDNLDKIIAKQNFFNENKNNRIMISIAFFAFIDV